MSEIMKLASAYVAAKQIYEALSMSNTPVDLKDRVNADLATRIAMRRMLAAQDAYYAALDAEAAK